MRRVVLKSECSEEKAMEEARVDNKRLPGEMLYRNFGISPRTRKFLVGAEYSRILSAVKPPPPKLTVM